MIERRRESFTSREQIWELRRQVLERLGWLNFHAYLKAIEMVVGALGYRQVTITNRRTVHAPTDCGGFDIQAVEKGTAISTVLIQVKQSVRPIQRRFVDELRGAMLRQGANYGMVITIGLFSQEAINAASLYPGRPIRLIAGPELARLMVSHFIGIRHDPMVSYWPRLVLDEQLFERLEELYR